MDYLVQHMNDLINTVLEVRFSDLEKERACCEELLKLSKEYPYGYATAFAYTYLGDYYLAQNNASLSGQCLYEAKQLCGKDLYLSLYMKVCHLLGFYYHLINDEQNALQYYMESISLAEDLGNVFQQCNAWNNIADMFQGHKQYEEAIAYYLRAYNVMLEGHFNDARLLTIVLYNLAEMHGYTNKLEEMNVYLTKCEANEISQDIDDGFHKFCCTCGRFLEASFHKNIKKAREIAEELLVTKFCGVDDHYIIIEFLLHVTQQLVLLREEKYAKQYLEILDEYCSMNETTFIQRLIDLRVLYAEAFSSKEELSNSYQTYCHTMREIISLEDDVRVSGMRAKIHLQEIIVKHESTLQENRRLEDEAHIDDLTNIYNRRYFNHQIERKDPEVKSLGIIMLDIDYFKEYNDSYGHIHGDLVLRSVGDTLNRHCNEHMIPCRFGGDEFVCICENQSDEQIEDVIQQVQVDLHSQKIEHKDSKCSEQITLSIGYCNYKKSQNITASEILRRADLALYIAKENGRNGWNHYRSKN